jgi:hypothetical protein
VAVGEGEWPNTGSQRHTPSVGPTLIAPLVPPTAAVGASAAAAAAVASPSQSEQPVQPSGSVTAISPATRDAELLKVLTRDEGQVMTALLSALEFGDMDKFVSLPIHARTHAHDTTSVVLTQHYVCACALRRITRAAVEYFVAAETGNDPNHPLLLRLLNGLIVSEISETGPRPLVSLAPIRR